MELKDTKRIFSTLEKKYRLPTYEQLNENFEVDKIDKDTECLLRLMRKVMMEKVINSLGFLELLLNPVNAPRMYSAYLRSITSEDRKIIEELYNTFSNISIVSLDLEIDYSEKKEAEAIKKIFEEWQASKPKFRKILGNMKKPTNVSVKKEKNYFG